MKSSRISKLKSRGKHITTNIGNQAKRIGSKVKQKADDPISWEIIAIIFFTPLILGILGVIIYLIINYNDTNKGSPPPTDEEE